MVAFKNSSNFYVG